MAIGTIEEWKVRAYAENVHKLAQGVRNKLRGTVREKNVKAKSIAFRRIAPMRGRKPTVRLESIVHAQADHSQRVLFPQPYTFDAIVDTFDEAEQIHNPSSEYASSGAADFNHEIDRRIVAAALGPAVQGGEGSAYSSVAFDTTNNRIVHASTGLTKAKILKARAILGHRTNNENEHYGPYYFVYDPLDLEWLLSETEITSADFVNVRALQSGEMVQGYLGFTWVAFNELPITANIRSCVAYAKAGMGFGANMGERKERMGERNDLVGHPMQVSIYDEFEAVRIDDGLVLEVQVDTTAVPS